MGSTQIDWDRGTMSKTERQDYVSKEKKKERERIL